MSVYRLSGILVWLTVLWLLLWSDLSWANVVAGLAVGVAVLVLAQLPRLGRRDVDRPRVHPVGVIVFVSYVLVALVQANLVLAREILRRRSTINVGIVQVTLRSDSKVAMMVVANVVTLTPGTITVEASGTPAVLDVNVLHLHDPETVRDEVLRIEALFVRAFGSRRARARLAEEVRR